MSAPLAAMATLCFNTSTIIFHAMYIKGDHFTLPSLKYPVAVKKSYRVLQKGQDLN